MALFVCACCDLGTISFAVEKFVCEENGEQMRCCEDELVAAKMRIEQTRTLYSVLGSRSFSRKEPASPRYTYKIKFKKY